MRTTVYRAIGANDPELIGEMGVLAALYIPDEPHILFINPHPDYEPDELLDRKQLEIVLCRT